MLGFCLNLSVYVNLCTAIGLMGIEVVIYLVQVILSCMATAVNTEIIISSEITPTWRTLEG